MTGCGRRRKCLVFVAGGMFVPWPKRAFLRRIFGSRLVLTANCTFSPICPPVEPGDFSCLFGGKKALACGYPRTGALSAIRSNSRHIAANRSTPVCCAPQGRIPTKTQPFSPKPGYVPAAVSFFRTAQQEKLEKSRKIGYSFGRGFCQERNGIRMKQDMLVVLDLGSTRNTDVARASARWGVQRDLQLRRDGARNCCRCRTCGVLWPMAAPTIRWTG